MVARIARIRMRSQPAPSGDRSPSRTNLRGRATGSGGDALRVVRATRDQRGVAWSAEADPLFWQLVCWDSRDADRRPRKEGVGVTEAAEEGSGARQVWQDEQTEAEEEDRAREVTAAGSRPQRVGHKLDLGAADRTNTIA